MERPAALRAEGDEFLARQLLEEADVQRVIARIEHEAKRRETRRQLLATAVRLSRKLMPGLHDVVRHCRERLAVDTPIELYVYPSSQLNAACIAPEDGRLFVLFSSELLEAFSTEELSFVVGHELAHHAFDHHAIPTAALLRGGQVHPSVALRVFAWSRYAEISSDRAGLYCAGDIDAVARGLFKLASGLRQTAAHLVMETLLGQVADIAEVGHAGADQAARTDWFATHPFSPIRLQAAKLFAGSAVMSEGGIERPELEQRTAAILAIMEPGYLKERTEEAALMRRLLLAASMLVANASDGISDREIAAIEGLLGHGAVSSRIDVEALRADLPHRISAVVEAVPPARRAQIVRDLCLIATADGHTDNAERDLMENIAVELGLGSEIVCQTMDGPHGLE